jgi:hypothetical protein
MRHSTIAVKGETLQVGDTLFPGTPQQQTICYFKEYIERQRVAGMSVNPLGSRVAVTDIDHLLIDNGQEYPVAA